MWSESWVMIGQLDLERIAESGLSANQTFGGYSVTNKLSLSIAFVY